MSLLGILRGLDAARVRFVVIGGMAGQLHGSSRLTNDVDICYDTAADNLAALATLLQRWRAYPRDIETGLPFIIDAHALHNVESLTLTTTEGNLDIFARVAGVGRYREAVAQSRPFDLDGFSVPTLTLDALIASKVAAGRPKDRDHVLELQALRDLAAQRDAEH
ncbi:MAG TPA: nucleotidyl transferase AbiEii/AbiGii toxin family protein [Gemmatimonadaceae bacterium]|nr:nucleotidyl transferase AbiEii/AbiGii toxin family protein [Gemmatimonadaceae bacterium]